MNCFNPKYICIVFALLCVATTLEAEQNSLKDQNPFKDLVDNNLEGFFLSGGVGFGIGKAEFSEFDFVLRHSSAQFQWKAGYVTSSRAGLYFMSPLTEFAPKFGVLWYLGQHLRSSRRYLQALVGFSDEDSYSGGFIKSLEGGFGYEFRPHFVLDVAAGYKRRWNLSIVQGPVLPTVEEYDPETDLWIPKTDTYSDGNDKAEFVVVPNELTLAVSVNYRFY